MTNPIFDIAPITEAVEIGGQLYHVAGVPIRVMTQAAKDSPEVMSLLFGGTLDTVALINKSPDVVATFIAWGFRGGDDPKVKEQAGNLPFDTQLALLRGILTRTMLGGAGPFVAEIAAFRKIMQVPDEVTETETVRRFRVKAAMPSPESSNTSSPTDTPRAKSGT